MDNLFTMIKDRVIQLIEYKMIPKEEFYVKIGMTSASFRGNAKNTPLNSKAIENILSEIPDVNSEWLITGKGEMLKHNIAGRDHVGTGNEIAGDNTGVIGNTGTVGNVGGNHVSIPSNNIKKIMNEDGVGIEFTQSTDSLQQRNVYLEARIKDLEILNASQAKTIETMQLLIDMLTKK